MVAPHDLPRVSLWSNGTELLLGKGQDVMSLRVQRRICTPAICEISLSVDSFATPIRIGQDFAVHMMHDQSELFRGKMTALTQELEGDGARQLRLRAHDPLDRLRTTDRAHAFADQTTAEIIEHILSEHDLPLNFIAGRETTACTKLRWPSLTQIGRSDLNLLQFVCNKSDLWFDWHDNAVRIWNPGVVPDAEAGPALRRLPVNSALLRMEITTNVLPYCAKVAAQGWNSTTGSLMNAAGNSGVAAAFGAGDARTRSGAAGLATEPDGLGASATQRRADHAAHGMRLTLIGETDIGLGAYVVIMDSDTPLNQPLPVASTTITLDGIDGLRSELSTDLIDLPASTPAPTILPATIVSVADPERLGRVKVTFDTAKAIQSGWLRVVLPGAGPDRGLIAVPDKGDRVVALQTGPTPDHALILGGVIGPKRRDMGVEKRAVKQTMLTTSDGQSLILDDAGHALTLTARHGATVTLGPDETRIIHSNGSHITMTKSDTVLHSKTDLTIEAPGRKMVIAAQSVDFQKR